MLDDIVADIVIFFLQFCCTLVAAGVVLIGIVGLLVIYLCIGLVYSLACLILPFYWSADALLKLRS